MLSVKNFTKSKINEKLLKKVAKIAKENIPLLKKIADLEIDLAIIGEKKMQSLNYKWRGKDKSTDVLSFESGQLKKNNANFVFAPENIFCLGEIIICYPVAVRQAREDECSLNKEMAILLIHGILHLAGYDHEKSVQEARKMFRLQEKIMNKI